MRPVAILFQCGWQMKSGPGNRTKNDLVAVLLNIGSRCTIRSRKGFFAGIP